MTRDVALAILKREKSHLTAKYGLIRLGVFGSVARDEARAGSDVDVYATMSQLDGFDFISLHEDLVELLGVPVDLVHVDSYIRPLLRERIEREGINV